MSTDGVVDLRRALVRALRSNGALRSEPVAAALSTVRRERFVPAGTPPEVAYADRALVLTRDDTGRPTSSISQPSMVALMLEQLDVLPGQCVLEIGTASGYNAALLAHLTGPAGAVTTIELDPELAATASAGLLRDHLAAVRPVPEIALRIVARPAGAQPQPGRWTVCKPYFSYVVDPC